MLREGNGLRLNLYHADQDAIDIRGRSYPLAADFSAPLGYLVAGIDPADYEDAGMFSPTLHTFQAGIRALEPYDPKKIPVVLVHGLWSNPVVWRFQANAIWGDPELRKRYQVWVHLYPTGLPLMASAHAFRKALDDVLANFAPDVRDPRTHDVVVVGHSLGGVISSTSVKTTGTRLWDAVFTKPLKDVDATPTDKALAENLLFFEAHPFVRRVIFICTPHGGTKQASSFLGRLGAWLIARPQQLTAPMRRLLKKNPGILRNYKEIKSSIDMLKPEDVILHTIRDLPVAKGVTLHSIIGQDRPGPKESGTDGMVPYSSSHIKGVASELVIRSDHSAEVRPACIAEVVRILRLHLRERDRGK
jgi:pimeloyl-ACP methyl ester carboxylesterase